VNICSKFFDFFSVQKEQIGRHSQSSRLFAQAFFSKPFTLSDGATIFSWRRLLEGVSVASHCADWIALMLVVQRFKATASSEEEKSLTPSCALTNVIPSVMRATAS
jgi:hypothetical protein